MDTTHLIGEPSLLARAHTILTGCGLRIVSHPLDDSAAPGLALPDDGGLAIALWPPTTQPVADEILFSTGVPVLHAWWDGQFAEVGPFLARGASCCPRCHRISLTHEPSSGDDPALASWTLSWAGLAAIAYQRDGTSELIGASWRWEFGDPGLISAGWGLTGNCGAPGCVSRRSLSYLRNR
ncbi:MAG TPA: hypothetical protein PKE40_09520 [Arachnia sp.]|nr:hypothetical protein [Arachnia sp.]HMT86579.1 hypothetical protein [Arachnia sp.]